MALAAPFFKVWGQKREAMGYLWLWLVGGVAIMSLSGGKRMHYILPTMPALAILIGIIVEDIVFERVAYTGKFARNVLAIHAGVIVAGAIGGTVYVASKRPELLTGVAVVSLLGLAAVGVTVWLFVKRKNAWATGAIFAGFCVVLMVAMPVMSADASFNRNAEVFAKSVSGTVPAGGRLTAYRDVSSRFVHHYGGVVPVVKDMDSLFETYEQGDWVVATGRLMEEVIADGRFALVKRWEEAEREGDEVVDGAVFGKVEAVENE
jgi:4-amino-4-deoxy-L-arabinose transferase-like glycosyltransferase